MANYPYDFVDFVGLGSAELDARLLQTRVEDEAGITTECQGVTVDDGEEVVTFAFAGALSGGEETLLDAIVAAFDGETLAEAKARCVEDCKTHLSHHLRCGCCTGDLSTALDNCDTAIANVMAAADIAAAEAARDAYVEA